MFQITPAAEPFRNDVILYSPDERAWLHFHQPECLITAWQLEEVLPALGQIEQIVEAQGSYAAGFLSYEAAPAFDHSFQVRPSDGRVFPLLWFGIFSSPARLQSLETVRTSLSGGQAYSPEDWLAEVNETDYRRAIRRIKTAIARGETYQVNYTYRLRASWKGETWPIFSTLASTRPAPYAAYIETDAWALCSFSPELFFSLDGSSLASRPMKGTARRGLMLEEDQRQATWLQRSVKNRAENVMIVDMVRNDLGRIGLTGSVQTPGLFQIEKYATVWQMTSTVKAETNASLSQIFQALFPAASITGAPKIRTMQIVARLEASPRRIYTGTIGYYAPRRKAHFNVAIRTLLVDKERQQAEYGVGGGIVWDSRPGLEWEETQTKALILFEPPQPFDILETMRWTPDEGWFLLKQHLERLARSAIYFSYPLDLEAVRGQLEGLAQSFTAAPQRVRLALAQDGQISIEQRLLGSEPDPQRVALARSPVNSGDRFLYHKTSLRRVYDQAREETAGFDDALLWNERGELTEACIANLIVELEGQLFTPPVRCGLLPGTYRGWLLAQRIIQERVIRIEELAVCSRVYLVNSVRGMWEIQVV